MPTVLGIIGLLLLIAIIMMSFYFSRFTSTGRRQTYEEAYQWQRDHYDTSYYDKVEKYDYTIKSFDGYELHVQLCKAAKPTDRYMIISHGYTDNIIGDLKYLSVYLNLGFNCVLYDLRGHGKNAPAPTTYGANEAKDLVALINDTRSRYGQSIKLGIHGESLGAATSITALKYVQDIQFVVADCGFADIMNVLKLAAKNAKAPTIIMDLASVANRIQYGYSFNEMRPIVSLPDNRVPILFIHGAADDFIIPDNSRRMAAATGGYSEVHFIEGATHAVSVLTDYDGYCRIVRNFVSKVMTE